MNIGEAAFSETMTAVERPECPQSGEAGAAADMAGTTNIFSTKEDFIAMLETGRTFELSR
jgi:hypothetical protein